MPGFAYGSAILAELLKLEPLPLPPPPVEGELK